MHVFTTFSSKCFQLLKKRFIKFYISFYDIFQKTVSIYNDQCSTAKKNVKNILQVCVLKIFFNTEKNVPQ